MKRTTLFQRRASPVLSTALLLGVAVFASPASAATPAQTQSGAHAMTVAAHTSVDTRINSPKVPGSAARAARRRLARLEFEIVAPPESFFVTGREGPLAPGELDRARSWGRGLATRVPPAHRTS